MVFLSISLSSFRVMVMGSLNGELLPCFLESASSRSDGERAFGADPRQTPSAWCPLCPKAGDLILATVRIAEESLLQQYW
ncbi:hypothetical protein ACLKA6_005222 [Drosophila palustris]